LVRGSSDMFTVRAVDAAGRTATAYLGTVHFTSSDPAAVLPADYTFLPVDQGAHSFNLTWMTAGNRSLTVTDTATPSLNGTVADIKITKAVRYVFTGIADPVVHGVADPFTLKAVDQFGNADRLVELGVARRLDVDATADELRTAVVALESSPEIAARCAVLREELRQAGGAAGAADIIEARALGV